MAGDVVRGVVRGSAPVWGDGFAGDGFGAVLAVTDWDRCSADEYAMLFPRLVPSDGRLPAPLSAHLAACVAARSMPASERGRSAPEGLVARLLKTAGLKTAGLRAVGPRRADPDDPERAASERRLLALLDGMLGDLRRGAAPAWSEDREAWFAFGSGIHPGYLWPESAVSPDRGLTAAWLGHLDRGRPALMPEAVAGYLLDAVLNAAGERDRALAAMVGPAEDAGLLRRAAAARLAGDDPVVRRGRRRAPSHLSRILRAAVAVREDALEHA